MGRTLFTAPALEPLTVAEAADHLRIDATSAEPTPPAPTVALAGVAGNIDNGAHRYRATFVTADGETAGGDISASITVADKTVNGQVAVSNIPIGGSRVTARKLYRTLAGGSTYFLVATISDNTTATYTDNIADASLGAAVPTTNTTDDPYLRALIVAARRHVEGDTGRALISQTWDYTLDNFPADDEVIKLPLPPLQSVTSVKYLDTGGVEQTMPATDYIVDLGALYGEISLAYGKSWPSTRPVKKAVTIRFVAGYGAAASSVPDDLRAALKLVIGDLYANRNGAGQNALIVNPALDRLLSGYRLVEVG